MQARRESVWHVEDDVNNVEDVAHNDVLGTRSTKGTKCANRREEDNSADGADELIVPNGAGRPGRNDVSKETAERIAWRARMSQ